MCVFFFFFSNKKHCALYSAVTLSKLASSRNPFEDWIRKEHSDANIITDATLEPKGTGAYGNAYIVRKSDGKIDGVLKVFHSVPTEKVNLVKSMLLREQKITKGLIDHKNIVNYLGMASVGNKIGMLFNYVPNSHELFDVIVEKKHGFYENLKVNIFSHIKDLIYAVTSLHEQGVQHLDLKPENILMSVGEDSKYTLKIIDFGFAHHDEWQPFGSLNDMSMDKSGVIRYSFFGTPAYLPHVEYATRDVFALNYRDWWAIGCVICVITYDSPLYAVTNDALYSAVWNKMQAVLESKKKHVVQQFTPSDEAWIDEHKFGKINKLLTLLISKDYFATAADFVKTRPQFFNMQAHGFDNNFNKFIKKCAADLLEPLDPNKRQKVSNQPTP